MKLSMRSVKYMQTQREKADKGSIREVGYYFTKDNQKVNEVTRRGRGIIAESLSYVTEESYPIFKAICSKFFEKFSLPEKIVKHVEGSGTFFSLLYGKENLVQSEVDSIMKRSKSTEVLNVETFYKEIVKG